jgi:anti-anti-sigma factor
VAEIRYFLRGEIDLAERDRIRAELATALERPSDLLVDCRHLTFLDSSGIAVLVEVRNDLEANGHDMLLVNVSRPVRRVLEVVGLTDLLRIERPLDDEPRPPEPADGP